MCSAIKSKNTVNKHSIITNLVQNSADIRKVAEMQWNRYLSRYGNLFSSDNLSGSSPPSVFVGSYGYPKIYAGPMAPPIHGNTTLLDSPEQWIGKTLTDIINYRLNLVRGTRKILVYNPAGRYIEGLQDIAMSDRPADIDIQFEKAASPITLIDGHNAPLGPVGSIKHVKFSNSPVNRHIEKVYYDKDLKASDAVLKLYNNGIEISKIQKCFSIGMFGHKRKLVPTRWSITATDDIISKSLINKVLDEPVIDSHKVFFFIHMGNLFSIILFPHRWIYEMTEAWYSNGVPCFDSDNEDARGMNHYPTIAGAYFAAKLAIGEYLVKNKIQAGVLILREILPEYAIPVGIWQVREALRMAMKQKAVITNNFEHSLDIACTLLNIPKQKWLSNGIILKLLKQKTLLDFQV